LVTTEPDKTLHACRHPGTEKMKKCTCRYTCTYADRTHKGTHLYLYTTHLYKLAYTHIYIQTVYR
jgi:hypothetical protein